MNLSPDITDHQPRILIVDDERCSRQLLEVMLAPEGFHVLTAASGEEALDMVARQLPDLILLDGTMPGMDGHQVVGKIKGTLATRNIPVIMVTSRDDHNLKMLGLNAGAEDFLTRPVDRAELCVRVRNLLRLKAYSDHHDSYSQMLDGYNQILEAEVSARSASLVRSERLYRSTFDMAPIGIAHVGLDGQWLRVNRRLSDLLGYSPEELQSTAAQALIQSEDVASETESFHRMAAARLDVHVVDEKRYRRRDGSFMWARVNCSVHRDAADQFEYFISVVEDITERKRAVDALQAAEERMRFALQNADVGIWDMDYATGVLRWSETLEAQYGLPPGTFGGTFDAFVERVHADDRASVLGTIGKAMKAGADFSILHRSMGPDGTVRWLNGMGRIHLGEHGEPVRGVGISLDVTERRTLEAQYHQAQKMDAIGRLAGGVAHDFNNLLTAILGYCELLLADVDPDDPRRADISEIQKAGMRAAGLTRQLLAFSRKQIIEPTLLDLNVIVANMRTMLARLIGEDVKVVLVPQPELALVKADHGQVEQVLMNLAVNARDAMPLGGTMTIETAHVEFDEHSATSHFSVKPGPYVMLTVTDTGVGMTPEVQAHLFEPFFTTKELGKGTGLGLATVHGIVTRGGGSVAVYSEVGRGTSFKVYFPREDAAAAVVEAPGPPASRPNTGRETVLVVEDEEGLRELAGRLLQRQGYTVLLAADADEAIELFEQNAPIDVLLTDVVMPGASGPELTRQLVEQRPALRVLYMSGYTEDAIVQHGVLKPGIAFLHKPFTAEILGRKIREVLDQ